MTAAAYGAAAHLPLALPLPLAPPVPPGIAALADAIGVLLRAETSQRTTRQNTGSGAAPPAAESGPGPAGRSGPPHDLAPPPHAPSPDAPPPAGNAPPEEPGAVWAIVSRAQKGDPEAFGELYDLYADTVFRYVHFRAGSRSQAEDLTSETFVRALRRIGSVSWQGRDFGAWLITIARNLVADHYKSARYRLEISTADMLDADRAEEGPENGVLDAMSSVTLIEAVKELNPEQQECIVLRFLQGFSVTETAQAMGKNEGTVKALQYRAIRTLGRLLPDGFVR